MNHIDWGVVLWLAGSVLLMGGLVVWFCFFRSER
jgi:hypothetical protein